MAKPVRELEHDEKGRGEKFTEPAAARRRQLLRPAFKAVFQFASYMIALPVMLVRARR
jgi:hypothetical protein